MWQCNILSVQIKISLVFGSGHAALRNSQNYYTNCTPGSSAVSTININIRRIVIKGFHKKKSRKVIWVSRWLYGCSSPICLLQCCLLRWSSSLRKQHNEVMHHLADNRRCQQLVDIFCRENFTLWDTIYFSIYKS